jgi:hypothetical protein
MPGIHIYNGKCPDEVNGPDARDPDCPTCRALEEHVRLKKAMEKFLSFLETRETSEQAEYAYLKENEKDRIDHVIVLHGVRHRLICTEFYKSVFMNVFDL